MRGQANTLPPVVICDAESTLYHLRPDGSALIIPSEDDLVPFEDYANLPIAAKSAPVGPIVTRIDFEKCEECDGKGRFYEGLALDWGGDTDEHGAPVPDYYDSYRDCEDCNGQGWRYDWGEDVALDAMWVEATGRKERAA